MKAVGLYFNNILNTEQLESISFNLNDSKRYRRTVGSIASSCITAATPLLASTKQAASLVALDIIEVIYCLSCFFSYCPCFGDLYNVIEHVKYYHYHYNYYLLSKHSF